MLPRPRLTAALYVRVSTLDQNDGMQRTELHQYCQRMDWRIVEYAEKKSSVRKRPVFDQLMADAREGKVDVVVVFMLDRWARSLKDLLNSISFLNAYRVRFVCPRQGIDTLGGHLKTGQSGSPERVFRAFGGISW